MRILGRQYSLEGRRPERGHALQTPGPPGLRGFSLALNERDISHLERAMTLAEHGRGCTSPNPLVGAVVVRGDDILGEGFHAGPGKDHAELAALKDAVGSDFAGRLVGATVYVTLEPCCHYGRTPPCTAALIAAGVDRVVAGVVDPSPAINGRGLDGLRAGWHPSRSGERRASPPAEAPKRCFQKERHDRAAVRHLQICDDARRPGSR